MSALWVGKTVCRPISETPVVKPALRRREGMRVFAKTFFYFVLISGALVGIFILVTGAAYGFAIYPPVVCFWGLLLGGSERLPIGLKAVRNRVPGK